MNATVYHSFEHLHVPHYAKIFLTNKTWNTRLLLTVWEKMRRDYRWSSDACLILTLVEESRWCVRPLPEAAGILASRHPRDPAAPDNPEPDVMLPGPSSPSDHSCSCNRRPRIGVLPAYVSRLRRIFRKQGRMKEGARRRGGWVGWILARRQDESDLIHRTSDLS